jgi:hypothetical protein
MKCGALCHLNSSCNAFHFDPSAQQCSLANVRQLPYKTQKIIDANTKCRLCNKCFMVQLTILEDTMEGMTIYVEETAVKSLHLHCHGGI